MTYTIEDVRHLIPEALTPSQERGIEAYLNEGVIPEADPCLSCEPNLIRKYISRVQVAQRTGTWPPKKTVELVNELVPAAKPKPKPRAKKTDAADRD